MKLIKNKRQFVKHKKDNKTTDFKNLKLKLETPDYINREEKRKIEKQIRKEIEYYYKVLIKNQSGYVMESVYNDGRRKLKFLPNAIKGNEAYSQKRKWHNIALHNVLNRNIKIKNIDENKFTTNGVLLTSYYGINKGNADDNYKEFKRTSKNNHNDISRTIKSLKKEFIKYGNIEYTVCIESGLKGSLHLHYILIFDKAIECRKGKNINGENKNFLKSQSDYEAIKKIVKKYTKGSKFIDLQPINKAEGIANYISKELSKQTKPIDKLIKRAKQKLDKNEILELKIEEVKTLNTLFYSRTYKIRNIRSSKGLSQEVRLEEKNLQEAREQEKLYNRNKSTLKDSLNLLVDTTKEVIIENNFLGMVSRRYLLQLFKENGKEEVTRTDLICSMEIKNARIIKILKNEFKEYQEINKNVILDLVG